MSRYRAYKNVIENVIILGFFFFLACSLSTLVNTWSAKGLCFFSVALIYGFLDHWAEVHLEKCEIEKEQTDGESPTS